MRRARFWFWMAVLRWRDSEEQTLLMKWMKQSRSPSVASQQHQHRRSRLATMGFRRLLRNLRLDPRCVRLFRPRLPGGCSCQQLPRTQRRHRLDHHHHAGHAAGGRGGVGFVGRPLWPPPSADCVRSVLLHHHGADSLRAQLRWSLLCCALSMESGWAATGASALLWSWRALPRVGGDSSPGSCRQAIRWDTCWPPWLCGPSSHASGGGGCFSVA